MIGAFRRVLRFRERRTRRRSSAQQESRNRHPGAGRDPISVAMVSCPGLRRGDKARMLEFSLTLSSRRRPGPNRSCDVIGLGLRRGDRTRRRPALSDLSSRQRPGPDFELRCNLAPASAGVTNREGISPERTTPGFHTCFLAEHLHGRDGGQGVHPSPVPTSASVRNSIIATSVAALHHFRRRAASSGLPWPDSPRRPFLSS